MFIYKYVKPEEIHHKMRNDHWLIFICKQGIMKKTNLLEDSFHLIEKWMSEDLDYKKVDDASPENDDYEMGEGKRSLARTRKKRLFTKAEIMANPNRFKLQDKVIKGIKP